MTSNNFTRYQKIIIWVYKKERTVPRTIKVLEDMTGEKYEHKSYVRKTVQEFKKIEKSKPEEAQKEYSIMVESGFAY